MKARPVKPFLLFLLGQLLFIAFPVSKLRVGDIGVDLGIQDRGDGLLATEAAVSGDDDLVHRGDEVGDGGDGGRVSADRAVKITFSSHARAIARLERIPRE